MQGERLKTREFFTKVVETLRIQIHAERRNVNVVAFGP